jgi:hypothetical protein
MFGLLWVHDVIAEVQTIFTCMGQMEVLPFHQRSGDKGTSGYSSIIWMDLDFGAAVVVSNVDERNC